MVRGIVIVGVSGIGVAIISVVPRIVVVAGPAEVKVTAIGSATVVVVISLGFALLIHAFPLGVIRLQAPRSGPAPLQHDHQKVLADPGVEQSVDIPLADDEGQLVVADMRRDLLLRHLRLEHADDVVHRQRLRGVGEQGSHPQEEQ
jgi:hypothetical protein